MSKSPDIDYASSCSEASCGSNETMRSTLKQFLIVEEEPQAIDEEKKSPAFLTNLIHRRSVISNEIPKLYWHPGAKSQNQHLDAVRYGVRPQMATAVVEGDRIIKLHWTKQPFVNIVFQTDKFRHALATWKTMSDTSSPEGTPIKRTQIKKTQKSRRKLTTTDEYNRESSKELRDKLLGQFPGYKKNRPHEKKASDKANVNLRSSPRYRKEFQRTLDFDELQVTPKSNQKGQYSQSEISHTAAITSNKGKSIGEEQAYEVNENSPTNATLRSSPRFQKSTLSVALSDLPQKSTKTLEEAINRPRSAVESNESRQKIDMILKAMTRLESTCATILQKVEKNEARLDTLMLANSTSKIDDPEVLALFPLQKEEDFVYVETKLKDSFEFRDKFCRVIGRFGGQNKNMSDQRVAVELLLGQVLHEDVTRFGSWTGIRRGADKAIINVLPFQDSEIFKIIQNEANTMLGSSTQAQHVIQEWIRTRRGTIVRYRDKQPDGQNDPKNCNKRKRNYAKRITKKQFVPPPKPGTETTDVEPMNVSDRNLQSQAQETERVISHKDY